MTADLKPHLRPLSGPRPRRRVVSADDGGLVAAAQLPGGGSLPLCVTPAVDGVDLADWAGNERRRIDGWLRSHRGILFRGFGPADAADLERLVHAVSGGLLEYTYRSTPRRQVQGEVYTSTEYPADRSIPMHNEMSYGREWPLKIFFLCVHPAEQGGETPIADSRRVLERVPPAVHDRFRARGIMYVRNYGGGLDLPWEEVFGTDDRSAVEAFCARQGIELEWLAEGRLRTRQVCQAVAEHPQTGEEVWFNQAHLFHLSALPPEARRHLLAELAPEDFPRNALFGDGSPIPEADLDAVRAAYEAEMVVFPWQAGDVLLLDNMLVAHGRRPFAGPRKVLVGMAEGHSAGRRESGLS